MSMLLADHPRRLVPARAFPKDFFTCSGKYWTASQPTAGSKHLHQASCLVSKQICSSLTMPRLGILLGSSALCMMRMCHRGWLWSPPQCSAHDQQLLQSQVHACEAHLLHLETGSSGLQ